MQNKATRLEKTAVFVTVVILLVTILIPRKHEKPQIVSFDGSGLKAMIDLGAFADTSRELITGYNYYLLEEFAGEHEEDISIALADVAGSSIDSLLAGKVDIIVRPFLDSIAVDSILVSIPIDSMSVWIMSKDCEAQMGDLNKWIDAYHNSDSYLQTRERFLHVYAPSRSGQRDYLSPYDSLIRIHAKELGWDWKMLAAVIYHESRFHIEARSRRGAQGLMQIVPVTAERFDGSDMLDPDMNIRTGVRYLKFLWRKFGKVGDNKTEKYKYTLAAYNAGEGRIQDCINYAKHRDVNPSYWDNVVRIIPEMNDPVIAELDFIVCGPFKGKETINYVESVLDIYRHFCRICPE